LSVTPGTTIGKLAVTSASPPFGADPGQRRRARTADRHDPDNLGNRVQPGRFHVEAPSRRDDAVSAWADRHGLRQDPDADDQPQ
jgi:hypothetical protein